ncbi:hypothetical protein BV898_06757 [Hypsibius exemplaris]|uniref:Uncharacterized protein n=1 Tax=Hypsibius exemplaris TaxID=2072580 RepID=A0A1W0WV82_HYPEX|nr:hypothetical protein BV898_06757 [Hypsibius exemplaris]
MRKTIRWKSPSKKFPHDQLRSKTVSRESQSISNRLPLSPPSPEEEFPTAAGLYRANTFRATAQTTRRTSSTTFERCPPAEESRAVRKPRVVVE